MSTATEMFRQIPRRRTSGAGRQNHKSFGERLLGMEDLAEPRRPAGVGSAAKTAGVNARASAVSVSASRGWTDA